jgi:hypothetical protein
MTKLLLPPRVVAEQDTEAPIRRFAEIVHQYDPRIRLEYIPELSGSGLEKPFRLVKDTAEHGTEILRYLSAAEMKRPQEVLVWLWEGDFAKHRPGEVFDRIQKRETAERMLKLKEDQDAAEARQDQLEWGIKGGRDRKHRLQLGRGRYLNR